MTTCAQCSQPFTGKRRDATYCSQDCKLRAFHERRQRRGYDRRIHTGTCIGCGATFTGRKGSKYCTKVCALAITRETAVAAASAARVKSQALVPYDKRTVRHVRTARRLTSGTCRVCGLWFISHTMDITCSTECQESYQRARWTEKDHRRRALLRNAFVAKVNRHEVFKRDNYRCHLCGKRTDPTQVVPHPKAPTIDHVIPLAAGGKHEPANCRTACFLCNATKGARGGGEQLLLIS